jgi:hypothetical protein
MTSISVKHMHGGLKTFAFDISTSESVTKSMEDGGEPVRKFGGNMSSLDNRLQTAEDASHFGCCSGRSTLQNQKYPASNAACDETVVAIRIVSKIGV